MHTHTRTLLAVAAAATLALTGCAKSAEVTGVEAAPKVPASSSSSSSTPAPAPTSDDNFPTPEPSDLETTTEEPDTTVTEGKFGDKGSFTIEGEPFDVTVKKGVRAKCHYQGISCDKPETGDRYVNVPIIVKNNGTEALELDPGMFALEFADGTRVDTSDGSPYQYGPDNTLDYGQKVRVGGTLKTSITMEAPNGPYSIVMLTNSFNGEDLFI